MSHSGACADAAGSASQPSRPALMGRQVKACKACRTTKIKCNMPRGLPPCERCTARGIECERSLESTAGESTRLPEATMDDIVQLQNAVNVLLRTNGLPLLPSYSSISSAQTQEAPAANQDTDNEGDESLPTAPIRSPVTAEDNSPYALPVSSLYEVTKLPSLRNPSKQLHGSPASARPVSDFISRGVLSLSSARQLFQQFITRLDFFCYGITCPHESLESLRNSSSLLTAAVCTVAALHTPQGSSVFKICHAELLKLISASMFSISYSTDDIRALIIGSWWLGNISYTLLGHAIRVAMRLDYHLAYFSVIGRCHQGEDVAKARLWYILYVMDHHSSILYGRPALLSPAEEQHCGWDNFIRETSYCEVDLRVSSQVALYHVLAKVNNMCGSNPSKALPEHCFPQLQNTFAEVDRWYVVWGNRMPRNAHVGWFARDGAILNYHFARLHLCSYVFRGTPPGSTTISSTRAKDYASVALASASSILQLVMERDDLRTALVGMPIYFHGMVNFAAVFLIKAMRNNFWGLIVTDVSPISALVQSYISELKTQNAARQHLVYHLANGLEEMVNGLSGMFTEEVLVTQASESLEQIVPASFDTSMFSIDTFQLLQGSVDSQEASLGSSAQYF